MLPPRPITVGLISDTHGLLRPEAVAALRGSDVIIHSGDIGTPEVLAGLAELAPVTAVRGNVDRGSWASALPATEVLTAGAAQIYVIHNVAELNLDPAAAGFRAVVSGHSHQPGIREEESILYINPGSAGPRRFALPVAVGRLIVDGDRITPQLITLNVQRPHTIGP
jgi:putative phosphoesterase